MEVSDILCGSHTRLCVDLMGCVHTVPETAEKEDTVESLVMEVPDKDNLRRGIFALAHGM